MWYRDGNISQTVSTEEQLSKEIKHSFSENSFSVNLMFWGRLLLKVCLALLQVQNIETQNREIIQILTL